MAEAETTHTARVHAWFISSEGVETHVTRRDDGRWYLNTTDPDAEPQFLAMDTIVDIYTMAVDEQRPHGWMPGLEGGERWDEAVRHLYQEESDASEADDAPEEE